MKYMKNGMALIVGFLLIYPIYFNSIPKVISQVFYLVLPVVYLIYARESAHVVFRDIIKYRCIKIIGTVFYVCFIFSLVKLAFQNNDISYFVVFINMISGIFKYFAIYVYILRNDRYGAPWTCFLSLYITVVCIYVLSSLMMLLNMDLRMLWQSLLLTNDTIMDMVNDEGMYVSRFGLQGWSGFTNTLSCSLAMLMLTIGVKNKLLSTKWLYMAPLLLLGNFFYGRVGAIVSISIFLFYAIAGLSLRKIKILVIFFLGLLGIMISKDVIFDLYPYFTHWWNWVLGPVDAIAEGLQNGEIDLGSSGNETMRRMYFIPEQDSTVILGDGQYQNFDGSYYCHTDAGFMRNLLYWGICLELIFYIPLFIIVYRLIKSKLRYEAITISLLFFIFEIKGDVYQFCYGLYIFMYYMLMKYCTGAENKNV